MQPLPPHPPPCRLSLPTGLPQTGLVGGLWLCPCGRPEPPPTAPQCGLSWAGSTSKAGAGETPRHRKEQIRLTHQLPWQVLFLFQVTSLEEDQEREGKEEEQGQEGRAAHPSGVPSPWCLSPERPEAVPSAPCQLFEFPHFCRCQKPTHH